MCEKRQAGSLAEAFPAKAYILVKTDSAVMSYLQRKLPQDVLDTHNMHNTGKLCDRVAFIVDGRIKALNTPQAFQVDHSSAAEVRYSYRRDGRTVDRQSTLTQLGQDVMIWLGISTWIALLHVPSALQGELAMMVVSLAGNRVEGLAISKLTSWFSIGAGFLICSLWVTAFTWKFLRKI